MLCTEEALVPIRFFNISAYLSLLVESLRVIVAREQLRAPGRGGVLGYVVAQVGVGPRTMLMTCY
jgi:hypothetical protein